MYGPLTCGRQTLHVQMICSKVSGYLTTTARLSSSARASCAALALALAALPLGRRLPLPAASALGCDVDQWTDDEIGNALHRPARI